jgi:trehalose 6-phosphate synthase/phosphatase
VPDGKESAAGPHAEALSRLRGARKRRLLLDYDGTLVDLQPQPEMATPDADLCELMKALSDEPRNQVVVVSGRPRPVLAAWLGHLPIGLSAEHGLWLRSDKDHAWSPLAHPDVDLHGVSRAMEDAASRHSGARVEHKDHGVAFHFRNAVIDEPTLAALKATFADVGGRGTWLIDGNCVLEVVPRGVSKALAIRALHHDDEDVVVFGAGDDTTDLSLLAALPDPSLAASVGERIPRHALWFDQPRSLRAFLRELL